MKEPCRADLFISAFSVEIMKNIRTFAFAMTTDKGKAANYTQAFSDYLSRTGRRRTPERFMILERVMAERGHFSIEELCERIAASGIHVALATAYNTLQLLVDAGIVLRHRFGDRTSLYECVHEASGHQHLICSQCGKVKEVRDTSLAGYLRTKRYPSFTPTCYSLSIYGLCSECARKERRSAAAPSKKTESTPYNT